MYWYSDILTAYHELYQHTNHSAAYFFFVFALYKPNLFPGYPCENSQAPTEPLVCKDADFTTLTTIAVVYLEEEGCEGM